MHQERRVRIIHEEPAWMSAGDSAVSCFYVLCRWTRSCQIWKTSHSRYRASRMGLCPKASQTELPKRVTYSRARSFLLDQISVKMVSSLHLFLKKKKLFATWNRKHVKLWWKVGLGMIINIDSPGLCTRPFKQLGYSVSITCSFSFQINTTLDCQAFPSLFIHAARSDKRTSFIHFCFNMLVFHFQKRWVSCSFLVGPYEYSWP